MSFHRVYLRILAAVILLLGMSFPKHALATMQPLQPGVESSHTIAVVAFPAVPENGEPSSPDAAWTPRAWEEAKGFTEAATADDPNPVPSAGSASSPSDPAETRPVDKPSHAKVPEPGSLVLIGTVLIGLARTARNKMRSGRGTAILTKV